LLQAHEKISCPEDILAACDLLKKKIGGDPDLTPKGLKSYVDVAHGTWKGGALGIELKEGTEPYHARAFSYS